MEIPVPDILYHDNHIVILNKKAGELVQGDKTGDPCLKDSLALYLKLTYNKPGNVFVGVVHRIDRPVSGAVVFARTSKALSRLNQMLQQQEIRKIYWAVVGNNPEKDHDRIIHYLKKDEERNKAKVYDKPGPGRKEAVLNYRKIGQSDRYTLLEVVLETGRHHQIRAQLARIGCPIRGDLKYGFPRSNPDGGISLHAYSISFVHPVKKERIEVIAPLPDDTFWKIFKTK